SLNGSGKLLGLGTTRKGCQRHRKRYNASDRPTIDLNQGVIIRLAVRYVGETVQSWQRVTQHDLRCADGSYLFVRPVDVTEAHNNPVDRRKDAEKVAHAARGAATCRPGTKDFWQRDSK